MNQLLPPEVHEKLKYYVYRLIDPRNGETFYVGRGQGNRLYSHVNDKLHNAEDEISIDNDRDDVSNKISRIRDIGKSGFEVSHVIHRHGMDKEAAAEVEAALIDAYPGLSNKIRGAGSDDRGVMHAEEIVRKYKSEPANIQHKALLVSVNRSASALEYSLYDSTRFAWKLGHERANDIEVVLPCEKGMIIGAFIPEKWMEATSDNFPGFPNEPGRLAFTGHEAPEKIKDQYVGCRTPDDYPFGSGNPVRYTW